MVDADTAASREAKSPALCGAFLFVPPEARLLPMGSKDKAMAVTRQPTPLHRRDARIYWREWAPQEQVDARPLLIPFVLIFGTGGCRGPQVTRFHQRTIGLAIESLRQLPCARIANFLRRCGVPEDVIVCANCSSNKSRYLEALFTL